MYSILPMSFLGELFSSRNEYAVGYQPAITAAYKALYDRYGTSTDPKIADRLKAILKLVNAIEKDIDIKNTVTKTLSIIRDDVFKYIKERVGGEETQLNVSPHDTTFSIFTQKNLGVAVPVGNKITELSTAALDTINLAFDKYQDLRVITYEAIKHDNNIINGNIQRPPIMKVLVDDIIQSLDTDELDKYVFSLIQWYLLHNETKGINLPAYKEMLDIIRTSDDSLKQFTDMLNMHLYHL